MATPASPVSSPIPAEKLHALVIQACDETLKGRPNPSYDHDKVKEWSGKIITSLLGLLRESHPQIKWFITVTLMQSGAAVNASTSMDPSAGKAVQQTCTRGVYIAQGAWWDNARDGMKSFDLWNERGYGGVDATVCVAWMTS